MFERATWDWDASPSLLVYGPEDNLAERRWAAWAARPSPDRLVEAALDEDRVRELRAMPPRTVGGAKYVFAFFGLERAKPAARRLLAGFLDGGRTAVLFAHSLVGLEGAASRCMFVRAPRVGVDDALARLALADRAACCAAASSEGARGRGGARAALTKLFQSGVTLGEFFRAVMEEGRRRDLVPVAAALERRAGFNAVVHAEAFLSHFAGMELPRRDERGLPGHTGPDTRLALTPGRSSRIPPSCA